MANPIALGTLAAMKTFVVTMVLGSVLVACGPQMRKVPNLSGAWLGTMTVTSSSSSQTLTIDGGVSVDDSKALKDWSVDFTPTVNSVTFGECLLNDLVRASDSVIALSGSCRVPDIGFAYCSSGMNYSMSVTGTFAQSGTSGTLSVQGSVQCGPDVGSLVPVAITGSFTK
jgi:hypothetical protein